MSANITPASIEIFKSAILAAEPETAFDLDQPDNPSGTWLIDLKLGGLFIPIIWSAGNGFGIFTDCDEGFGERPNEYHRSAATAAGRLIQIVRNLKAGQPAGMTLSALRELQGISQAQLAEKLGVGQATVSKLENRSEVQVGTLQRAIFELGGELVMTVRLPESNAELVLPTVKIEAKQILTHTQESIPRPNFVRWSRAREQQLIRLWKKGFNANQIALKLGGGISRNAIIAKIHQLRLSRRIVGKAYSKVSSKVRRERVLPPAPRLTKVS